MFFNRINQKTLRHSSTLKSVGQRRLHNLAESRYNLTENQQTDGLLQQTIALQHEINKYYKVADSAFKTALQQKLRHVWTYHASAIEGSTLSQDDITTLLKIADNPVTLDKETGRLKAGDSLLSLEDTTSLLKTSTFRNKPRKFLIDAKHHGQVIDLMVAAMADKSMMTVDLIKYIHSMF